ncbi:RNA polymerase sigma factor SigZ [Neptuniibacter sp. QD48_11]|uniref:RNA polymerase sigma factor SigZ n=1 Tax=unclassified Neptuniibacter TaxID=2630693 RepID=UPI0039F45F11
MNIESIWQQYSQHLRAFLLTKVSNPDDVEDLLQEILLKTHQQISSLKAQDKLKPWLFKIATNKVIDFYRQQGREIPDEVIEQWYTDEQSTEHELSACILPFINALPSKDADLLRAIDIEGQSQKGYATELGVNYSALKSRVQRARVQLRHLFEECCTLEFDRHGKVITFEPKHQACKQCKPKRSRG